MSSTYYLTQSGADDFQIFFKKKTVFDHQLLDIKFNMVGILVNLFDSKLHLFNNNATKNINNFVEIRMFLEFLVDQFEIIKFFCTFG